MGNNPDIPDGRKRAHAVRRFALPRNTGLVAFFLLFQDCFHWSLPIGRA
jgi:hypothetical protein